jgi:hypothetical protein
VQFQGKLRERTIEAAGERLNDSHSIIIKIFHAILSSPHCLRTHKNSRNAIKIKIHSSSSA